MKLRKLRRTKPRLELRQHIACHWAKANYLSEWIHVINEYCRPNGDTGMEVLHPLGHHLHDMEPRDWCIIWGAKTSRPPEPHPGDGGTWK